jgi:hypothetical protein
MRRLAATSTLTSAVLCLPWLVGCGDGSRPGGTGGAGAPSSAGATSSSGATSNTGATSSAGSGGVAPDGAAGGSGGAGVAGALGAGSNAGGAGQSGSASNGGEGAAAGGTTAGDAKFSFFVTSLRALLAKAGPSRPEGFGGDLSFGETGAGAGLRGADKLCAAIAEDSMPGAGSKPWRAFLSAVKDENGKQVDAIERIGSGPWYDRLGRLVAASKGDLLADRPQGADDAIVNDLPNEDGVPNRTPDPTQDPADNHHVLTGSSREGKLQSATATCLDWTSNLGEASEGRPRAGLAWPRAMTSGSATNWMSAVDAPGCAAGVRIVEGGGPKPNDNSVGNGGGYGAFYCFSLVP